MMWMSLLEPMSEQEIKLWQLYKGEWLWIAVEKNVWVWVLWLIVVLKHSPVNRKTTKTQSNIRL